MPVPSHRATLRVAMDKGRATRLLTRAAVVLVLWPRVGGSRSLNFIVFAGPVIPHDAHHDLAVGGLGVGGHGQLLRHRQRRRDRKSVVSSSLCQLTSFFLRLAVADSDLHRRRFGLAAADAHRPARLVGGQRRPPMQIPSAAAPTIQSNRCMASPFLGRGRYCQPRSESSVKRQQSTEAPLQGKPRTGGSCFRRLRS